jgi:hypothetical protein
LQFLAVEVDPECGKEVRGRSLRCFQVHGRALAGYL